MIVVLILPLEEAKARRRDCKVRENVTDYGRQTVGRGKSPKEGLQDAYVRIASPKEGLQDAYVRIATR